MRLEEDEAAGHELNSHEDDGRLDEAAGHQLKSHEDDGRLRKTPCGLRSHTSCRTRGTPCRLSGGHTVGTWRIGASTSIA